MHPWRLLLTGLAAGLVLAGCSDPEPKVADPTPTLTPTASTSVPTASSTPIPEPLSPTQTVRAWVGDWNIALQTGDTAPARAYAADPCRNCESFVTPVEEIYAAGGSFEGGMWTAKSVTAIEESPKEVVVALAAEVGAGSTVAAEGRLPTQYPASKRIVRFTLVPRDGAWRFSSIELLS